MSTSDSRFVINGDEVREQMRKIARDPNYLENAKARHDIYAWIEKTEARLADYERRLTILEQRRPASNDSWINKHKLSLEQA
jgi:predicted DNA-binding protein YlxM (UPF0122 family)